MSIASQIEEKKQETPKQAIEMTPEEAQWLRVKEKIRTLPTNYQEILEKAIKGQNIAKKRYFSGHEIEVPSQFEGVPMRLSVYEDFQGNVKRVYYLAYARHKDVVFIRDVLKEDPIASL